VLGSNLQPSYLLRTQSFALHCLPEPNIVRLSELSRAKRIGGLSNKWHTKCNPGVKSQGQRIGPSLTAMTTYGRSCKGPLTRKSRVCEVVLQCHCRRS
jgi:hypothetical protein